MHTLLKKLSNQKKFQEETDAARQKEEAKLKESKDIPPVFNKRLFSAQGAGGVVITNAASKIMENNLKMFTNYDHHLNRLQLASMRAVTQGLKLIHLGLDYVKDVLAYVVSLETYEQFQYVKMHPHEDSFSCYYILNGNVEVTYIAGGGDESLNMYEANILYSHGTGEYLGLVSHENPSKDLAPPATIYTKEPCIFLRVDRRKFHFMIKQSRSRLTQERWNFINSGISMLSELPQSEKESLVDSLIKHEFSPNRPVLLQDKLSDYVYFVLSGHLQCCRKVFVNAFQEELLVELWQFDKGDMFGEESILYRAPSYCSVITKTRTVLFKLHRSEFEKVGRENLNRLLEARQHVYQSDKEINAAGNEYCCWENYKRKQTETSREEDEKARFVMYQYPPKEWTTFDESRKLLNFIEKRQGSVSALSEPTIYSGHGLSKSTLDTYSCSNKDDDLRRGSVISTISTDRRKQSSVDSGQTANGVYRPFRQRPATSVPSKPNQNIKSGARPMTAVKENETSNLDSREIHRLFYEKYKKENRYGIFNAEETENSRNVVEKGNLVTMDAMDIVKHAKRVAEDYARKIAEKKPGENEDTEDTVSVLGESRMEAKTRLWWGKYRMIVLDSHLGCIRSQLKKQSDKINLIRKEKKNADELRRLRFPELKRVQTRITAKQESVEDTGKDQILPSEERDIVQDPIDRVRTYNSKKPVHKIHKGLSRRKSVVAFAYDVSVKEGVTLPNRTRHITKKPLG